MAYVSPVKRTFLGAVIETLFHRWNSSILIIWTGQILMRTHKQNVVACSDNLAPASVSPVKWYLYHNVWKNLLHRWSNPAHWSREEPCLTTTTYLWLASKSSVGCDCQTANMISSISSECCKNFSASAGLVSWEVAKNLHPQFYLSRDPFCRGKASPFVLEEWLELVRGWHNDVRCFNCRLISSNFPELLGELLVRVLILLVPEHLTKSSSEKILQMSGPYL